MKNYYRIMPGPKSRYAEECLKGNFIGADFLADDLTGKLPEDWREFNRIFIPVFLSENPGKTKVAAGLACGMMHTIAKGMRNGDIVICPDGRGNYFVGEVIGDYTFRPETALPQQRPIRWLPNSISRIDMSDALRNSTGSIGTVSKISRYADEIENLLGNNPLPVFTVSDETIEDPAVFALEKHLEEFLVKNWKHTELGKNFEIVEEDGQLIGQQYQTDTGNIDILAINKNKTELLVVELKKGRASDIVVGQIQRYMGYVLEELAEKGQSVKGVIIALEDDLRIRRALAVAPNIEFYRYQVSFKLFKADKTL